MDRANEIWKNLGDLKAGRPNLGPKTDVLVYRLMQFTMRSVLSERYGDAEARSLLKQSGKLAGVVYCQKLLSTSLEPYQFIAHLSEKLIENGIGILKTEKADLNNLEFIFTVSEDLDCSGLPVTNTTVCDYDEGFIQGILETYLNKKFIVTEIDCWATGDTTCRFEVKLNKGKSE